MSQILKLLANVQLLYQTNATVGGYAVITPSWAFFFSGSSVSLARVNPLFLAVTGFRAVL